MFRPPAAKGNDTACAISALRGLRLFSNGLKGFFPGEGIS
jgi:hypothetical protein